MGAFVAEVNQHQGIYQKLKATLEHWEASATAAATQQQQQQQKAATGGTGSSHPYGFAASAVTSSDSSRAEPVSFSIFTAA